MWLIGYDFWLLPKIFNDNTLFGDYSQLYSIEKYSSSWILRIGSVLAIVLLIKILHIERVLTGDEAIGDSWIGAIGQQMLGNNDTNETTSV